MPWLLNRLLHAILKLVTTLFDVDSKFGLSVKFPTTNTLFIDDLTIQQQGELYSLIDKAFEDVVEKKVDFEITKDREDR